MVKRKPIEADSVTIERCEECGRLALVMGKGEKIVAYACPTDEMWTEFVEQVVVKLRPKPEEIAVTWRQ